MIKNAIYIFFLLIGLSANAHADQLETEVIYRAAFGSAQDVRLLIERGANTNTRNAIGQPLIHIAAGRLDEEAYKIVQALLEAGVDANTLNAQGEPPIIEAAKRGSLATVEVLLERLPALKNVKDVSGRDLKKIVEDRNDKQITFAINKGLADEEGRLKEHQSDDNLVKNLREYSYLNCANQYLNYYVGSGQNPNVDIIAFNNLLRKNDAKIDNSARNLRQYFSFEAGILETIARVSKNSVVEELDNLGGNEERTVAGVGTDRDLNRRCNAIASQFSKAKFKITPKKNQDQA